ncbi:MAG: two-component regulator propeller domain-containing protein [Bacteroidota bacterium]
MGFWLMVSCCDLFAQNSLSFRQLAKKEGLSQSSVFAIAQDHDGFMWFGTRDGLNKYDGYNFSVFYPEDTAVWQKSNDIRTLFFDPLTQHLWVGTTSGLYRFRPEYDDFVYYEALTEQHKNNFSIRSFYRDAKNRLWVGTIRGLFLYLDEENRFQFVGGADSPFKEVDVKVLHQDRAGDLWFGADRGLFKLVNPEAALNQGQALEIESIFPAHHIKALLEDEKGNFWIGTQQQGVFYWDRRVGKISHHFQVSSSQEHLSDNNIRSMIWGKDQSIWVGTFKGLNRIYPETGQVASFFHNAADKSSLSHSSVRALFLDKRGSLWVGTYFGGISYADAANRRFHNLTHSPFRNSISHNVVSCFAEDGTGNWWIGTEGGGLNYFDRQSQGFLAYPHRPDVPGSISSNNVKTLLRDGPKIWVGTFNGGLDLFDPARGSFEAFTPLLDQVGLPSPNVYTLLKDGQKLWIGTYGSGLKILDLSKREVTAIERNTLDSTQLSSNQIRTILLTRSGEKWLGTDQGINRVIKERNGVPTAFQRLLKNRKVYVLKQDQHGHIWAGTLSSGLYQLDTQGQIKASYTVEQGLPGNSILGILEDDHGNLWLSTSNGIAKFHPRTGSFTNYNFSDGLENIEYNYNAYFETQAGEMLFGGTQGMTFFAPEDIYPSDFIPSVVLTKLWVQNREVKVQPQGILTRTLNETAGFALDYSQASFSIAFASLDYFNPSNNVFAYQLEGLEKEWIYTKGQTEVSYTLQNPGEYIFRLKGGNSDGVWNQEVRTLAITILPPPWKTPLAYTLYGLILFLMIFGILRFFRLRDKLKLEQLTKQKQEELHEMKARFFTNITHEFRTPLTLILGHIEGLSSEPSQVAEPGNEKIFSIRKNARRLLALVDQLLTFRKIETDHIEIRASQQNIVSFLADILNSFQADASRRDIDLQFFPAVSHLPVYFDADKLEKVFYNLLSNAFKFTPDGGKISLSVSGKNQQVVIKVKDNGRGISPEEHEQVFQRFFESEAGTSQTQTGSGIGLAISQKMVALHAGTIGVESVPGQGATFIVQLPLGKAHFKPDEISEYTQPQVPEKLHQSLPIGSERALVPEAVPVAVQGNAKVAEPLKLLIVEDNPEVLAYIGSIFSSDYQVEKAINGKAALKKASVFQPDLILSDIMMPEMDGIAFCRAIKQNLKTSHIPIILLTAKAAQEHKIEGLELGADDYVTKPFDPKELKLRVANMAQARIQMRNRFSRILNLTPTEVTVTSADEAFLKNAIDIVEKNIDNIHFNVVQFAYELAVSRPLLFTKLKAITNLTPNNFIKTIRLKRAAQILEQKKLNVSEVAYRVGFKDPRYFSKCFQKQFEKTPTEYMEEMV